MREDAARNIVEDPRLENLNAGEHQRLHVYRSIKPRCWHPRESGDEALMSLNDAEFFAVSVLEQDKCRQRVSALVLFQCSVQINICNDLSVDDDEGVVFQEVSRVIHGAAGAQDNWLVNVFQLDAKLVAIAKRALN